MSSATQNEVERLVRVNREQQVLLDQIYEYVDEQGLGKLGQSRVKVLIEAHKRAEVERDFLIAEYERAVGCGAQGFAHAAGHLFNAITNAKVDINTKHFLALRDERDALAALCAEAADVLDKTANDTLLGRNMADKLRRQAEEASND